MLTQALLLALLAIPLSASPSPPRAQLPLIDTETDTDTAYLESILEVRYQLHRAEIIPTVVDDFFPGILLNVTWPSSKSSSTHGTSSSSKNDKKKKKHKKHHKHKDKKKTKIPPTAALGNTLKPKKLQDEPGIWITDDVTSSTSFAGNQGRTTARESAKGKIQYTVILTDPDAPSRDNPEWSEMCHWIITGLTLPDADSSRVHPQKQLKEIVPYKPPGPPPKTGKHRYVFLVLAPANATTLPLNLSKPKDRQHWGYDGERMGVRQWADANGLVPVGANFIYAQNAKQ
jgi:phosphatidylethanolamine-binding protein (PEBP) family uncharacterized protein